VKHRYRRGLIRETVILKFAADRIVVTASSDSERKTCRGGASGAARVASRSGILPADRIRIKPKSQNPKTKSAAPPLHEGARAATMQENC